ILARAAAAAARPPDLTPRPSQYVFIRSLETAAAFNGSSPDFRLHSELDQAQPAVSGASPAPSPTLRALTPAPGSCAPEVAYPVLPTSPGAMLSYLYRTREGDNPPAVESYIHAGDLLRQDYLRPAELAALFRALERIPGVSVAGHAVNLIWQRGIAVQQTYHGISDQLIFNPRTYAVIGERQVVVSASSGLRVGAVLDATAVLKIAVVDHVGQRP
ncbi:MAG: hypothetical protein ACRDRJ_22350, partial [Streptosporangiaceae bacterium]